MSDKIFEIHVHNHLDDRWQQWFQADKIESLEGGETVLFVRVPDQPALHGLLEKIRDLNLTLISVQEVGSPPIADRETNGES